MRRPIAGGDAVAISGHWGARRSWHLWGMLGGIIWATGAVLNFVAYRVHVVGPAVSYYNDQGATMISAAQGIFIWREFTGALRRARAFLTDVSLFSAVWCRSHLLRSTEGLSEKPA